LAPIARLHRASARLPGRIMDRWKRKPAPPAGSRPAAGGSPPFRLRPILPAAATEVRPRGERRMICLTHVLPHPPRAGNEYRLGRMLTWLSRQGWEVLLIVVALTNEGFSEDDVRRAAMVIPNLVVWQRDGTLLHHVSCDGAMLEGLDGRSPGDFAAALG